MYCCSEGERVTWGGLGDGGRPVVGRESVRRSWAGLGEEASYWGGRGECRR